MKKKGGILITRAEVDSSSINADTKEFDVVFATENPILRSPWWSDESFFEVLVCDKKSIRAERLDAGVVPLLDTHNNYSVTGQYGIVRTWNVKSGECRATIRYSGQVSKADTWTDIASGIIRSISVGAKIHQYERVPNADPKKTPTYRAVDWEVLEISLAPVPLDFKSSVRSDGGERGAGSEVTGRAEDPAKEHEIEILNYTLNRSVMTPEQMEAQRQADLKSERERGMNIRLAVRTAKLGEELADSMIERGLTLEVARAEIAIEMAKPPMVTAEDAIRAERQRVNEITTLARAHNMEQAFTDGLIKDGKTLDVARTEILAKLAAGDVGPANGGSGGPSAKGDERSQKLIVMVEGMMHRAAPGSVPKFYDREPTKEDIDRGVTWKKGQQMDVRSHDYKHMSFIEMTRAILTLNGVSGVASMSKDEVVKRALDTTDLPDLFTTTVKRFMRMDYEAVVPDWIRFSREVPADDFRVKTGIKFDAAVTFEELDEEGEYKESNIMNDEKATIQLKTYARSFNISRQTIINDDLGIITRIPKFIGLGAAQFQSKAAWGNIINNVNCPDGNPLFHAKHGNLAAGAGLSVINDASLNTGSVAMARQKSPNGNELDITPAFILVPPELMNLARKFLKGINPTMVQNVNLWDFLEPFKNVYFTDTKAWYMVANPETTTVDGMVHAYLSGQEGLYTESYVDKKTDKIVIKNRMDFATSMWGWQGWYKNPGAAPTGD